MDPHFWLVACKLALIFAGAVVIAWLLRDQKKHRQYIQALENASDFIGNGLIFFDKKDRLVEANEQARDFLPDLLKPKGDKETAKATSLKQFLDYCFDHAADIDEGLLNLLGRAAVNNDDSGFREVITASEDRLCMVEAQKTPDGGTSLILIDVGDIKNQEEQILRLNQFTHELYQAVQVATSGVIITKPQQAGQIHRIVFANDAFFKIMGLADNNIIGQDMADIFERIEDSATVKKIRKIGESQKTGTVELYIKHSDKGDCWYDLKLTPVKDAAGNLDLFIGIMNDVTDLKLREGELSKTQKLEALGQLSAGVAHDFNNVLSIIDGYARLTAKNLQGEEVAVENLDRIRVAAKRGMDLIRQMLTFARHEIIDNTVIDLSEALSEQEMLLKPLLDASIKFKLLTDKQDMFVECPPETLTQILMNLVVNARDAMPYGGTLLVEARACPQSMLPKALQSKKKEVEYASLLISDTGTGMSEETMERIFDPFFTTKDQGQGTGLGLSMVYGLVKQIGGHIEVKSTLGNGSTFMIFLPLTDKRPAKVSGDLQDVSSIRFDGYTALVAEDEPDLLELIKGMLEELGMNVLSASNGHEALAIEDEFDGKIDLLLTDVVMPELNGVDLAGLMQDLQPEAEVVFMSGYPAKGDHARVQLPDGAVFVPKPIVREILVRIVYNKLLIARGGQEDGSLNTLRWSNKRMDDDSDEDAKS